MSPHIPELTSIRQVVDLYIDGVKNGNLESLRQAFHPNASMFGYKGQDLFITPIAGLTSTSPAPRHPPRMGQWAKNTPVPSHQYPSPAMPLRSRWRWSPITSTTLSIISNCSRSMAAGGLSASSSMPIPSMFQCRWLLLRPKYSVN